MKMVSELKNIGYCQKSHTYFIWQILCEKLVDILIKDKKWSGQIIVILKLKCRF